MSISPLIPLDLANEYGRLHVGYDESTKQHILYLDGASVEADTLPISPQLYSLILQELV